MKFLLSIHCVIPRWGRWIGIIFGVEINDFLLQFRQFFGSQNTSDAASQTARRRPSCRLLQLVPQQQMMPRLLHILDPLQLLQFPLMLEDERIGSWTPSYWRWRKWRFERIIQTFEKTKTISMKSVSFNIKMVEGHITVFVCWNNIVWLEMDINSNV